MNKTNLPRLILSWIGALTKHPKEPSPETEPADKKAHAQTASGLSAHLDEQAVGRQGTEKIIARIESRLTEQEAGMQPFLALANTSPGQDDGIPGWIARLSPEKRQVELARMDSVMRPALKLATEYLNTLEATKTLAQVGALDLRGHLHEAESFHALCAQCHPDDPVVARAAGEVDLVGALGEQIDTVVARIDTMVTNVNKVKDYIKRRFERHAQQMRRDVIETPFQESSTRH